MEAILSTAAAAKLLKCSPRTVLRHATAAGLGTRIRGGVALTPAEVERIRSLIGQPGTPGNQFWRLRKRHGRRPVPKN